VCSSLLCAARRPLGLSRETARSVCAGAFFSLVVMRDGSLFAFGSNAYGELCNGSGGASRQPVPVRAEGLPCQLLQAAAGRGHTLLLSVRGQVLSAGRNAYGQLGRGFESQCEDLHYLDSLTGNPLIVQVAAGNNHSLAIDELGKVFAWGCNDASQLGDVASSADAMCRTVTAPRRIRSLSQHRVVQIAAGHAHSLCLTESGVFVVGSGCPLDEAPDGGRPCRRPPCVQRVDCEQLLHAGVATEVAAGAKHSLLCDNPQSRSVGLCSGACDDAFFPESDGTAAAEDADAVPTTQLTAAVPIKRNDVAGAAYSACSWGSAGFGQCGCRVERAASAQGDGDTLLRTVQPVRFR